MKIRSISMQHYMATGDTPRQHTLPDSGITIIRGPNGTGKSQVIEAVATAVYGKTLRGTSPWHEQAGALRVDLEAAGVRLAIQRGAHGSRKTMSFSVGGAEPVSYDTVSKAQAELAKLTPPFDVWRRACILSSADSAAFSCATDKERKLILESVVGLGRFDKAHAEARKATLLAEKEESAAQTKMLTLRGRKEEVDEAERSASEAARVEHQAKRALLEQEVADLSNRVDASNKLWSEWASKAPPGIPLTKKEKTCPTCKRPFNPERDAEQQAEYDRFIGQRALIQRENHVLLRELRDKQDALTNTDTAEFPTSTEVETLRARRAQLAREMDAAQDDFAAKKQASEDASLVCKVLGLDGVRDRLLAAALKEVERLARPWLEVLFPKQKVALHFPDTSTMTVDGLGHADYAAASAGQRRRIDIANLLALGELASSNGVGHGSTLWLDEVFDNLDADGCDVLADLLQRLGRSRPVVLITHSEEVARQVQAVQTISLG